MRSFRAGPLLVHATGGADRNGGGEGPAVILCHGFGAPGTDLVSLARVIDAGPDTRWFFPEAPIELDLGWGQRGRAWWEIDMMEYQRRMMMGRWAEMMSETPKGLAEARGALDECLTALGSHHGVDLARTVLGGFSQGAMLTTDRSLTGHAGAGLAVLSGAMIARDRWTPSFEKISPGFGVFQSHGRQDPILPFAGAEVLRDALRTGGATVDWVAFAGQHEIPGAVLEGLSAFLQKRLAG
jgi:phospholipase/carboxylesterase